MYIRPLDISVYRIINCLLISNFPSEKFNNGYDNELVKMSLARIKYIVGQWLMEVVAYLQYNPHIAVNGFRHAEVYRALGKATQ